MADSVQEEEKKVLKEIPVIQDQGFFTHDTGDTYEGFFEAKKKDRNVKMHGPGVYTTAEGDVYTGTWDADRLGTTEEVSITFTDGAKYEGMLKDWCYTGSARYTYPDESMLVCDFVENSPVGNLRLIDPNCHIWLGKAELGYAWLQPINHYYNMLEKTKESKARKRKSKDMDEGSRSQKF
ncbi:unnamed protein product [Leptosia nina]|uniref:MORN repeat-containing protein 5 n=1 Tax=Leptosia nina TaxID=320188 RepID=A0AAV1K3J1_9NEOP